MLLVSSPAQNASGVPACSATQTALPGAAFSADTAPNGTTNNDLVTKTATQTLSGNLGANLLDGETVYVSLNNGTTWLRVVAGADGPVGADLSALPIITVPELFARSSGPRVVTLVADTVAFYHWWGKVDPAWQRKAVHHIFAKQLPDGGWNIYPNGPPEVNATIKAYLALKLHLQLPPKQ